ncbi:MAG: RidA family protein [Bacillota bacterium]|nr:RidA family protein [Bacillota bacterium]
MLTLSIEEKLAELGIDIPEVPTPVAAYVPAIQIGDLIYTSGQIPFVKGELKYKGKVGVDLSVEEAYEAAKACAINCIAAVKSIIEDLDEIEQIVKVTGYVNCSPDFAMQPQVVNGASEILGQLFEEAGKHARAAVGVSSLPLNAAVEVDMIVKIKV